MKQQEEKRIEHQADMAEDTVLSAELTHDTDAW